MTAEGEHNAVSTAFLDDPTVPKTWTKSHPILNHSNPLPKNPSRFIPAFRTHAILLSLPPPDGSQTVRSGREEGLLASS